MNAYSVTNSAASTLDVWTTWNECTNSSGTILDTWTTWNDVWVPRYTSTTDVWTTWNDVWVPTYRAPIYVSSEEREIKRVLQAEYAQQQAEMKKKEEARRAKQTSARNRAKDLFLEHVTKEQLKELENTGKFRFRSSTGKLFEMEMAHHGRLFELDAKGNRVKRFCTYPSLPAEMDKERLGVPDYDSMLAQKLLVEADEEMLKRVANVEVYN